VLGGDGGGCGGILRMMVVTMQKEYSFCMSLFIFPEDFSAFLSLLKA
jgi:hypothetical protein